MTKAAKYDGAIKFNKNTYTAPRHPDLAVVDTPKKGRGVIAIQFIPSETLLEVAPVIRLTKVETSFLAQTILDTYVFDWQEPPYDSAVLLGVIFLVNHSAHPNAKFERDFHTQTMHLIAIKDIEAGEEVTINYNCDLWFEVK
jgi:SET domain-containing protein